MTGGEAKKGEYAKVPLIDNDDSDNETDNDYKTHYVRKTKKRKLSKCKIIYFLCASIAIGILFAVFLSLSNILFRDIDLNFGNNDDTANLSGLNLQESQNDASVPPKLTGLKSQASPSYASAPPKPSATKAQEHKTTNEVPQVSDWEKTFTELGSESVLRLVDVDDDGKKDIILGASVSADLSELMKNEQEIADIKAFCAKKNKTYPCVGKLFALRGYDGEILWETSTRNGVFLMNCVDFDINQDGTKDCIVTGRTATIEAINIKNGKHLWLGDDKFLESVWNIYQVFALPDFNNDGVKEVLMVNGGDPNIPSKVHDRKAGRLILLDGKTGKTFGKRYMDFPDSKESYQSPVLYTCSDGSQYILLGSGGETVPGDFMMISVPDLYRYIMELDESAKVPNVRGAYRQWPHKRRDKKTGLIVLYRGAKKGVMVPPLITDVNHDGVDDVVMSSYDGHIILFDGKTMNQVWSIDFPNMESYSTPAPGYFNDDNILDFMVHWSTGAWPFYSKSQKVIIDGKDGSIIWKMKLRNYEMASDLTLQTTEPHRDIFLFKVKGREAKYYYDINGEIHGVGVQRKIQKRYDNSDDNGYQEGGLTDDEVYEDYKTHNFQCENDVNINSEVFMIDRTILDTPIKVQEIKPEKYNYHPPIPGTREINKNKTYCILMLPEDRTTGVIGDTDGDGILDMVTLTGHTGELVDERYSYTSMIYTFTVKKVSLDPLLKDKSRRTRIKMETILPLKNYKNEKDVSNIKFLPLKEQQWTSYFGSHENGIFKTKQKS